MTAIFPGSYTENFVTTPDETFRMLRALKWEKRDDAPRHEYYCNDFQKPYVYGRGRGRRTYEPSPWHPVVLSIRYALEDLVKAKFEVCFLNLYLNQSDHLGWHADDSPEMDDARPIAVVSLGVAREIWFRPKGTEGVTDKRLLGHGSLLLMPPGMQDAWQHRIPKASFQCGERISLTFRGYVDVPVEEMHADD